MRYYTKDGLRLYDLAPHSAELCVVAGPIGYWVSDLKVDSLPDGFRWVGDDEYRKVTNGVILYVMSVYKPYGREKDIPKDEWIVKYKCKTIKSALARYRSEYRKVNYGKNWIGHTAIVDSMGHDMMVGYDSLDIYYTNRVISKTPTGVIYKVVSEECRVFHQI